MGEISTLKIGTWNVWYAHQSRLEVLGEILSKNEADIWVLTETHDDLVPASCAFSTHSEPRPKNWSGIRLGSRWVSIWSKFPMEQIFIPVSDTKRTVAALVNLGRLGELIVYGTVLPWKDDEIPGWSKHHRVIEQQSAEWLALRKRFPNTPLCIAGDFNTDMESGRRYGTKQGVTALKRGLEDCDTFCATEPGKFPLGMLDVLPIDHIALPNSWQSNSSVVSAWNADKSRLSDHSGMVVEVLL
jgi:hypothetical protein